MFSIQDALKIEHGIPARDKFFPLITKQLKVR